MKKITKHVLRSQQLSFQSQINTFILHKPFYFSQRSQKALSIRSKKFHSSTKILHRKLNLREREQKILNGTLIHNKKSRYGNANVNFNMTRIHVSNIKTLAETSAHKSFSEPKKTCEGRGRAPRACHVDMVGLFKFIKSHVLRLIYSRLSRISL